MGEFPIAIDPFGSCVNPDMLRPRRIGGCPVGARNLVWTAAGFPMLAILDVFGENTVAAFVIARRIWGIMNAPATGPPPKSGRAGARRRGPAEAEGVRPRHHPLFVATYVVFAALTASSQATSWRCSRKRKEPRGADRDHVRVHAACVAVVFRGSQRVERQGPLDAASDTKIPFMEPVPRHVLRVDSAGVRRGVRGDARHRRAGARRRSGDRAPAIGLWGVYSAFVAETTIPAAINYGSGPGEVGRRSARRTGRTLPWTTKAVAFKRLSADRR